MRHVNEQLQQSARNTLDNVHGAHVVICKAFPSKRTLDHALLQMFVDVTGCQHLPIRQAERRIILVENPTLCLTFVNLELSVPHTDWQHITYRCPTNECRVPDVRIGQLLRNRLEQNVTKKHVSAAPQEIFGRNTLLTRPSSEHTGQPECATSEFAFMHVLVLRDDSPI